MARAMASDRLRPDFGDAPEALVERLLGAVTRTCTSAGRGDALVTGRALGLGRPRSATVLEVDLFEGAGKISAFPFSRQQKSGHE